MGKKERKKKNTHTHTHLVITITTPYNIRDRPALSHDSGWLNF